ncbi:MAG: hypothetical protein EOO06_08235 [Chitinophagaceae bacterium]|nr:MAG: hypothetical protein EOO06_08235 [Chitinophagaceae bacterium]
MPGKILLFLCFMSCAGTCFSQKKTEEKKDSFFLAKKKGILGKIGRSISRKDEPVVPISTSGSYKKYHGKIIRHIVIKPVGFNYAMGDTTPLKNSFAEKVANSLHKNSTTELIRKNLFFKEGQHFYSLQVADNDRYLRTLEYLRDAIIKVVPDDDSPDSVDVVVLTRDVFSLGGKLGVSSADKVDAELSEENIGGSGNRLSFMGLYDKERNPNYGVGAEFMFRNIKGSFLNWTNGFQTFRNALNSGRDEERTIYSKLERPMVSRYTSVTGALEFSYSETNNGYLDDSLYQSDFKYSYFNADFWLGYNFGSKRSRLKVEADELRHFVAFRSFVNSFYSIPEKFHNNYNYLYANLNGFLASYNIYRQNFYRTNFIYGFGRNEDVPVGIKAGVVAGFTNKQGAKRGYYGAEVEWSRFSKAGCLHAYTLRMGGFAQRNGLEDIDLLASINHFTKLTSLNKYWFNRNFLSVSYTRQINPLLNEPLFLDSEFGLPYYQRGLLEGEMRTSVKMESVFYHMKKILGFRFAPFAFTDIALLQPLGKSLKKTIGYPALGAGVRTRNENLVFGTMELRGYFIPKPLEGMKNWKVEVSTKLQFKYNSNFIRRPDFVSPN